MKVHFATQIYTAASERVFERIMRVLEYNLGQPWISKGTVFLDRCNLPLQHPALTAITLNRRATYADFFSLADGDGDQSTHLLFCKQRHPI